MQRGATGLIGVFAAVAVVAAFPGMASAATRWALQTLPLPAGQNGGELGGVSCPTATMCIATDLESDQPPAVEQWNGTTWSAQALPYPHGQNAASVNGISCASATSCTATGEWNSSDGNLVMMAEHWNGTTWTPQTIPYPGGITDAALNGISCAAAARCTAVGDYFTNSGTNKTLAEHRNGTMWVIQATLLPPGANDGNFDDVSCSSARNCVAVGFELDGISCPAANYCTAAGWYNVRPARHAGDLALAEFWNGSIWRAQETAQPASHKIFGAVSCAAVRTCTAVGGIDVPNVQMLAESE